MRDTGEMIDHAGITTFIISTQRRNLIVIARVAFF